MSNKVEAERSKAAPFIPADTGSAIFLDNPHLDNLMTVVIALGAEIWADRQRILANHITAPNKTNPKMVNMYE